MGVIGADFKKPFKLIRGSVTTVDKGRAKKGATVTTNETGSVQAATEEEMLQLPEGKRNKGGIIIFTEPDLPLLGLDEVTNTPADLIEFNSQLYQVQITDDWTYLGLTHHTSIATRVERDSGER